MEKGVFMLFGGRKFESSSIIEAYSQTFHVPYVSPSFADNVQRHLSTFQLHMKPSHTKALVDLIIHFGWRNYHYVYDSEEGLYRMQELVRTFEKKRYLVTVRMRRLQDIDNAHEDLRALDKQADDDNIPNKYILLDLSKESHYYKIMKQIREVGMNKHGYHYIMGTMDFLNLNMERYRYGGVNITGFQLVNYSSTFVQNFLKLWRGLNPILFPGAGNDSIHIDAALAVDAIEVIQRTLRQLIENSSSIFKHTFRRGEVYNHNRTRGVPCDADPPVPWMHGEALTQGMKKLHFDGVTGNIEFDEYGFRKQYKFDVYNVGLNIGPNKIGEWSIRGGVYTEGEEFPTTNTTSTDRGVYMVTSTLPPHPSAKESTRTVLHRHGHNSHQYGHRLETDDRIDTETMEDRMSFAETVRAMNAELGKAGRQRGNITKFFFDSSEKLAKTTDEPFLMVKKGVMSDGKPWLGNDRYEGFCAELTRRLFHYLDKPYRLMFVKDGMYGVKKYDSNNQTSWNGMIGELLRGEAEVAVAPLTITSEREEVVDFSKPFMDVGLSIMIKKPEVQKPGVFSFMQPLELKLWLCLVLGYATVGIGIFFVSRVSGAEWRRHPVTGKIDYNKFNLPNSLLFAMGSLMLQGCDDACPRSVPGRILGGAWWFAVLIAISSYTANLAAFLTIEKLLTPIQGADDLAKQTEIAYGTLASGSTQDFFKNSNVPTYTRMWYYMESATPSVFVQSMEEGIKRVRESKGKYAFLMESVYNEYANNQKPCNTMKVGHNINSNHYGIATRKLSILRYIFYEITLGVLKLTEEGVIDRMKKDWWGNKGECGFNKGHKSKKKSLSLSNVAGIYFILIAGLVFAIIVGVCEFLYIKSKPDGVPSAVRSLMVFMMPGTDTLEQTDDATDDETGNHKTQNGPSSPANGNAQAAGYFSYDPVPSSPPPLITVEMDANTSV
ncbi:glutamate receptor-like [Dreissena polymorpha]|uniref:glutamate receptor-like n=1 Tax=Dreissena polymorpha TaxID=45954 RepID=UPI0022655EAE|nr:glutamate receptor-like [Dreissena polymorpha]